MATPKVSTDDSTDLDEAVLNQYLSAVDTQWKLNACAILFDQSATSADLASGFAGTSEIASSDISWDGSNNEIDVTLSGYSNSPVAVAHIMTNSSSNAAAVYANVTGTTEVQLEFQDATAGGGSVAPDGDVQVGLIVLGK